MKHGMGIPALLLILGLGCAPGADDASATRDSATRAGVGTGEPWGVGRAATDAEVAAWDLDVNSRGYGLPVGRGTHADGVAVYAQKCAMCHGARGEGVGTGTSAIPRLISREPREGFPFGESLQHVRTVGNYWPYATTLYDYMQRAMPLDAPGSLTPDELYSLTAFLLAENEIIARDAIIDARSLPEVRMPARGRFVRDDRGGGGRFR